MPPNHSDLRGIVEYWGCIEHPDITVISRALLIAHCITPRGTRLSPWTSTRRTLTFRACCRRNPARRIAAIMIDHPCWENGIVACHPSLTMAANAQTCRLRQSVASHVAPRFVRTRWSADPGARDSRLDGRMLSGAGSGQARSHSARDRCACAAGGMT